VNEIEIEEKGKERKQKYSTVQYIKTENAKIDSH